MERKALEQFQNEESIKLGYISFQEFCNINTANHPDYLFIKLEALELFHTQEMAFMQGEIKETAIKFADYLGKLSPSQKVSLWSKNGEHSGIFNMDNEQLYNQFKKSKT